MLVTSNERGRFLYVGSARLVRAWLAAAIVGGGLPLTASTAFAAGLVLTPSSGPPGTTVSARGTGFCASCGALEIDFGSEPVKQGIAVAADGSFQANFEVPGDVQAGTNAVNVYQQNKLVWQSSFTVTPSEAPPNATPAPPQQNNNPPPAPNAPPAASPGAPQATPTPAPAPSASANVPGGGPSGAGPNAVGSTAHSSNSAPPAVALMALVAVLGVALAGLAYWRARH